MSESDLELRIAGLEQLLCDGEERIKELEAQVIELRQSLIGGIEGVRAGRDLKKWAEANDRLLKKHGSPKR